MKIFLKQTFLLFLIAASTVTLAAQQLVHLSPTAEDMTPVVRKALEKVTDRDITLVFEPGIYYFQPDYTFNEYRFITNHDNGIKEAGASAIITR